MGAEEKPASLFALGESFEPPTQTAALGAHRGEFVALRGADVVASNVSISLLMNDARVDLSRDLLIFVEPE
jgi:hypothetical protein